MALPLFAFFMAEAVFMVIAALVRKFWVGRSAASAPDGRAPGASGNSVGSADELAIMGQLDRILRITGVAAAVAKDTACFLVVLLLANAGREAGLAVKLNAAVATASSAATIVGAGTGAGA
eukprot:NODE_18896_length_869_cov_7.939353.p2 GENE.NODE_18896_length_869_cov_7.939353~~NODE_18896_length_869_cov_7.939353.p2  ORF type:complete len:121 (-),score=39.06 NODE_18896_length_869_cov_7.939353:217-579(-)